jgi:hypothetical protein
LTVFYGGDCVCVGGGGGGGHTEHLAGFDNGFWRQDLTSPSLTLQHEPPGGQNNKASTRFAMWAQRARLDVVGLGVSALGLDAMFLSHSISLSLSVSPLSPCLPPPSRQLDWEPAWTPLCRALRLVCDSCKPRLLPESLALATTQLSSPPSSLQGRVMAGSGCPVRLAPRTVQPTSSTWPGRWHLSQPPTSCAVGPRTAPPATSSAVGADYDLAVFDGCPRDFIAASGHTGDSSDL